MWWNAPLLNSNYMTHHHDLYAIGNALVDTEYEVSDAQLQAMGVAKRHMTLIDTHRRAELLGHVKGMHARRTGGGSAGNTAVALAQLGGKAFYSCRVGEDELGAFYRDDLVSHGVATNLTSNRLAPDQTGSCMVMVTPDAERSMSTFLGTSADLDHTALQPRDIAKSRVYYMEGYLAASPTGLDAALKGRAIARDAGVALAVTLSDMSMINFCRPGLDAMVGDGLDYLFCNEEESQTWCGSQDLGQICTQMAKLAKVVCLTRSAKGCIVLEGGRQIEIPAVAVKALDTNGAGDMFAGAFLYAITQGHTHTQAAWLGNLAAGKVVSQYGNRLNHTIMADLKAQFAQHLA
jgi:sugar/nucleoside kinase (ribokinase family)